MYHACARNESGEWSSLHAELRTTLGLVNSSSVGDKRRTWMRTKATANMSRILTWIEKMDTPNASRDAGGTEKTKIVKLTGLSSQSSSSRMSDAIGFLDITLRSHNGPIGIVQPPVHHGCEWVGTDLNLPVRNSVYELLPPLLNIELQPLRWGYAIGIPSIRSSTLIRQNANWRPVVISL